MVVELLHEDVAALLRDGEHRYSTGRRNIVEALHAATGPVTIPQILALNGTLAQSSVYRNLVILEEVGAVSKVVTNDDHARYELAEQLTNHHHHHLICGSCGLVSDFELPATIEKTLDGAFRKAGRNEQFQVDGHRLDLLGTCEACA